jgi:hypothetical protein
LHLDDFDNGRMFEGGIEERKAPGGEFVLEGGDEELSGVR